MRMRSSPSSRMAREVRLTTGRSVMGRGSPEIPLPKRLAALRSPVHRGAQQPLVRPRDPRQGEGAGAYGQEIGAQRRYGRVEQGDDLSSFEGVFAEVAGQDGQSGAGG